MRRRDLFKVIAASAAAAWPLALHAQQSPMPVIGFMHGASAAAFPEQLAVFREGLKESGFVEGRNVTIEYRWADGQFNRLPGMAADLVSRNVAVIVALGGVSSNMAAKEATRTIPIVFVSGADPIKLGLVSTLNRPGGNVTGYSLFIADLGGKALGILHELLPNASLAALLNSASAESQSTLADLRTTAQRLGIDVHIAYAGTPAELEQAFANLAERRVGGLVVGADVFFGGRITQLVSLAERHRIPTIYYRREFAEKGGLMSYGTDQPAAYRLAGVYAGRILKGEKPADMPVVQPTKFELVVNLKTAKTLGVRFPPNLLALADAVIE
jgi:putative ABC transport system substrate-binding protein